MVWNQRSAISDTTRASPSPPSAAVTTSVASSPIFRQIWASPRSKSPAVYDPDGGMLADATCDGRTAGRPLAVLTRHLTFGLGHRETVESVRSEVGGRQAERTVVRGTVDGAEVAVEAVVLKDERCVYDFMYVAPAGAFEAGRADFRALVESFSGAMR